MASTFLGGASLDGNTDTAQRSAGGYPVVVAVMIGEPEAAIERAGAVIVVGHLKVETGGGASGGASRERARDNAAEALAPMRRGDLDGGQASPVAVARHPADGECVAGRPDRRERLPRRRRQQLYRDRRQQVMATVVVAG